MIRLLFILLIVAGLTTAMLWFSDNDGSVIMEWMGYRIQTSVSILTLTLLMFCVLFTVSVQFFFWCINTPKRLKRSLEDHKKKKGMEAVTQGFVAIASGDSKEARHYTSRAESFLGKHILTRLLSVQTAQLEGDVDTMRAEYTAMLEHDETELIAIKGLLVQARQDKDWDKAAFLAEKLEKMRPNAEWILPILLDCYKRTRQWKKASETLNRTHKNHLIDENSYRHLSAVLHLAEASYAPPNELLTLTDLYATAYKRDQLCVPAVLQYAAHLRVLEEPRKAKRILEQCWDKTQHPHLLDAFLELHEDLSHEKRFRLMEKIVNQHPDQVEGRLLVARLALQASQLDQASHHAHAAIATRETVGGCRTIAAILKQERASAEEIENWLRRAEHALPDPAWRCTSCNHTVQSWHHECPSCRGFDTLNWYAPTNIEATVLSAEPVLYLS
jgi:HemY protein